MSAPTYIIMFSGGITSWAAAKRIAELRGPQRMILLFADTLIEDEDSYRFITEAAANIGAPLIRIAKGETPWQVFARTGYIGNSRVDPCSKELKRHLLHRWVTEHHDPREAVLVYGLSWNEPQRIERVRERTPRWHHIAPLRWRPWLTKQECIAWAEREGLRPPRMYAMGFPHANCGGFCVKAGQATFRLLLQHFPDRYHEHEVNEEAMRASVGDHAIMKDRRGGTTRPLTMRAFRERMEQGKVCDLFDHGGCGCAID